MIPRYIVTPTPVGERLGTCEHLKDTVRCRARATVVLSPAEGFWNTLEDLYVCQAHADYRLDPLDE